MSEPQPQANPIKGLHHVAIDVADFEASIRFYKQVFGFTEKISWGEGTGRGIMLNTGDGSCLEIFARGTADQKPAGAWTHLALRASDCRAILERARAYGAEVIVEPKEIAIPSTPSFPAKIAFIKGPDGEEIELFEELG